MAITKRVTKTVTEHYDDSEVGGDRKTSASSDSPSLIDIKANRTKASATDDESIADPPPSDAYRSGAALDAEAFSVQLKNWLGHHIIGVGVFLLLGIGSVIGATWAAASSYSKITASIDKLTQAVPGLDGEVVKMKERLLRLEFKLTREESDIQADTKK